MVKISLKIYPIFDKFGIIKNYIFLYLNLLLEEKMRLLLDLHKHILNKRKEYIVLMINLTIFNMHTHKLVLITLIKYFLALISQILNAISYLELLCQVIGLLYLILK